MVLHHQMSTTVPLSLKIMALCNFVYIFLDFLSPRETLYTERKN